MLRKGREVASYLRSIDESYPRSIDEESEVHTVSSMWLNVYHIGLEIFRERLTLDDIMTEDETTQARAKAGSGCATDESRSSSRRCRHI